MACVPRPLSRTGSRRIGWPEGWKSSQVLYIPDTNPNKQITRPDQNANAGVAAILVSQWSKRRSRWSPHYHTIQMGIMLLRCSKLAIDLWCKGPLYREWSIASCLITTIEPLPKPMPRYHPSPSHRVPATPYGIGKAMPCWKPSRSIVRISVHFFVPIPPVAICDAGRRETPGAFDLCVTAALRDDASERRSRLGRMAPR